MPNQNNEKPIIFSAPMVRAILDGRKTMTRRVFKMPKGLAWDKESGGEEKGLLYQPDGKDWALEIDELRAPYSVGDVLWVRETWETDHVWDDWKPSRIPDNAPILWTADHDFRGFIPRDWGKSRPSIFMPRWASRITLEIKDVRVERVQDISAEDAIAEGITEELIDNLIRQKAAKIQPRKEFWIQGNGYDESESYCLSCGENEIKKLNSQLKDGDEEYSLGGGYDVMDNDSQPFCEICGCWLDCLPTVDMIENEFEHFLYHGFDVNSSSDCHSLEVALENNHYYFDLFAQGEYESDNKYKYRNDLTKLGHKTMFAALWDSINAKRGYGWDANPWVWVYEFKGVNTDAETK